MTQPAKSVFRSFESCRMRQESGCRACQDCGGVKYLAQAIIFPSKRQALQNTSSSKRYPNAVGATASVVLLREISVRREFAKRGENKCVRTGDRTRIPLFGKAVRSWSCWL